MIVWIAIKEASHKNFSRHFAERRRALLESNMCLFTLRLAILLGSIGTRTLNLSALLIKELEKRLFFVFCIIIRMKSFYSKENLVLIIIKNLMEIEGSSKKIFIMQILVKQE